MRPACLHHLSCEPRLNLLLSPRLFVASERGHAGLKRRPSAERRFPSASLKSRVGKDTGGITDSEPAEKEVDCQTPAARERTVRAVRKPGFNLPSLQGNEILMAVAALALIIIIPQIVVYFFYNAENAFIGFMLAVEQSIVRLLLLAFRSFGMFAAVAGFATLLFFGVKSKFSSPR